MSVSEEFSDHRVRNKRTFTSLRPVDMRLGVADIETSPSYAKGAIVRSDVDGSMYVSDGDALHLLGPKSHHKKRLAGGSTITPAAPILRFSITLFSYGMGSDGTVSTTSGVKVLSTGVFMVNYRLVSPPDVAGATYTANIIINGTTRSVPIDIKVASHTGADPEAKIVVEGREQLALQKNDVVEVEERSNDPSGTPQSFTLLNLDTGSWDGIAQVTYLEVLKLS